MKFSKKIFLVAVNIILFLIFLIAVVNYENNSGESDPNALTRLFFT